VINRLFKGLLDFMIPQLCVSCREPVEENRKFICEKCSEKLIPFGTSHPWHNDLVSSSVINDSFSLYRFIKDSPIQYLLHSLKYEKMKSIGILLGNEIASAIPLSVKFDFAIPVPLHKAKERERTYNQSDYICRGIAEELKINVLPELLIRTRFTKSQTKMDRNQRIENVKDAFQINPKYPREAAGKNIILVDDVITTGSTILECVHILKNSGANYIITCSAAYDALD
jgi:ComF family protein